jgi:PilZ domain-containing protein
MKTTERRHFPRIAVRNLAYLNLEPDNGGILIDISEGGICFRSAVPVPQNSTVHFSFSLDDERIETSGRLAWSDATRKRGGLRFTSVSPEARRAISDWIDDHKLPVAVNDGFAASPHSLLESASLTSSQRPKAITPHHDVATGEEPSATVHPPGLLSGFSGGLVAGILISMLAGTLLMLQTHRREFGGTLIRWGERLGGSSTIEAALPEPETVSLALLTPPETQTPSHLAVPRQERLVPKPPAAPVQSHEKSLEPVKSATSDTHLFLAASLENAKPTTANGQPTAQASPRTSTQANITTSRSASSSTPARPSVPANDTAPISEPSVDMARPSVAQVNLAAQPLVRVEESKQAGSGSPAEKFLEVGRFNKQVWVDKTTEKLSQFGFPFSVVQKNNLWKKSYQVLVGPYGTDQEAETVHKTLASRGFTPRSFERGSRDFRMPRVMKVDGASLPVGDCTISWESYLPNAIVRFQTDRTAAVAEGKWVERKVKYGQDAVVFTVGRDGARTLTEIRFSGMGRALVFGSGNI